ncbi:MAG: amidohydrolase family protein, partial [Gammaproteobacteria bacterium]|nr:amidohydrolase family protein [Gammaproteobacteria bacterium]
GCRPIERLRRLGLLIPPLVGVHMTQIEDEEIALYAQSGAQVVHCPQSNLKLASGHCPVLRLLHAGINVALGTDGAASNNDLDMFGEMRSAAMLAKSAVGDPTALPAERCLEMATLGAARALALDEITGSIEPGKQADLVAVDLDHPATQPVFNPVSQIVYAAGRDQVSDVWVAGRAVVENGALTSIDTGAAIAAAERWRKKISEGS